MQVAADYLGVSDQTVRKMIGRGDLTAYKVGTGARPPIRVDLNQIDAELLRPIPSAKG
jgi:excisionase family DNA binding protein